MSTEAAKASSRRWYAKNRKRSLEVSAKWKRTHKDRHVAHNILYQRNLRARLLAEYGSSCMACGENDPSCLSLDHVYDNGAKERRTMGEAAIYRRALLPQHRWEYQLLCMNCQWRKRKEGPDPRKWFGGQIDLLKMCEA